MRLAQNVVIWIWFLTQDIIAISAVILNTYFKNNMKFTSEIEIDDEHLKVLLDYHSGYELNDEYFNLTDKQEIEREMCYDVGLLEGGFYQHYPLEPTGLGRFILSQYLKNQ